MRVSTILCASIANNTCTDVWDLDVLRVVAHADVLAVANTSCWQVSQNFLKQVRAVIIVVVVVVVVRIYVPSVVPIDITGAGRLHAVKLRKNQVDYSHNRAADDKTWFIEIQPAFEHILHEFCQSDHCGVNCKY